jgi:hypothetical protein
MKVGFKTIRASGGCRPPSLVGGGICHLAFQGLSKNMCQPEINGDEQSEKSLQMLIFFLFWPVLRHLGGYLV